MPGIQGAPECRASHLIKEDLKMAETEYDKATRVMFDGLRAIKYTAINLDYCPTATRGFRWTLTAKSSGVRVMLGHGSSWRACFQDARQYVN